MESTPTPTPTPTTTHLLLCATHRTGSNLLEEYLKAAGVAGRPREYYSKELSREFAQRMELPDPGSHFLGYHRAIVDRWTTSNGVFAAKIMWRHLAVVHERVGVDADGGGVLGGTAWETLLALHPAPKVVWVTRKDKIKQAISMVRAKQTGVFSSVHVDYGRKEQVAPGEYDFHVLQYHVEKLTAEDAAWEAVFRENNVKAHQIVFEEFVKHPQERTISLLQALGLPEPKEWHWPAVKIRSQSDPVNAEWYDRYQRDALDISKKKDEHREKRHRARKALERQRQRTARWERWQKHAPGRLLMCLEQWWVRAEAPIDPADARGDGVTKV